MTGLSNYFHPDEVMQKLAGVISDGLKYHAAAMQLVSADDQIDDLSYEEAIEEVEKEFQDPRLVVATKFAENRSDLFAVGETVAVSGQREFVMQKLTLNVSFNRMRRRFRKEIARITTVPPLKPPSNSNKPEEKMLPAVGMGTSKEATNVASMEDWRTKLRKSA